MANDVFIIVFYAGLIALIWYVAAKKTVSKRFYLSTIVIVLGVLMFLSDLVKPFTNPVAFEANPFMGIQIIMGALVYRSIKRSRLGRNIRTTRRKVVECVVLVLATLPTIWTTFVVHPYHPSWKYIVAYEPARFTMPIWFYIAYLIMWKKKPVSQVSPESESPGENAAKQHRIEEAERILSGKN